MPNILDARAVPARIPLIPGITSNNQGLIVGLLGGMSAEWTFSWVSSLEITDTLLWPLGLPTYKIVHLFLTVTFMLHENDDAD